MVFFLCVAASFFSSTVLFVFYKIIKKGANNNLKITKWNHMIVGIIVFFLHEICVSTAMKNISF